jgi:outer membrane receptor for ferric coprogen and ferric-rhodotorulic acid
LPRRRLLLPQALAQNLLIAALGSSGIAAAQSTDDGDKATQAPASQTLQTVQVTANQLGTITEGSGAYTWHHRHRHPPGADATADTADHQRDHPRGDG